MHSCILAQNISARVWTAVIYTNDLIAIEVLSHKSIEAARKILLDVINRNDHRNKHYSPNKNGEGRQLESLRHSY